MDMYQTVAGLYSAITDIPTNELMGFVEPILWLAFFICTYFLPTIVADLRKRGSVGAIFFVNLVLGWTVLGWFIALVWSLTDGNKYQRTIPKSNI